MNPTLPRRTRSRRRAASLVAIALALGLAVVTGTHPALGERAPTGPTSAPATAPTPVACLDQRLRPADRCPAVQAAAHAERRGDDLIIRIENAGDTTWKGGPLAVELPVPDADVRRPEGRDDPAGTPGTAEWTTRVGTVVSRCVFEPVRELSARAQLSCRLHLFGLPDGEHELWLTGFVGGLPRVQGTLGDAAPAPGVVAAATPRSFRVQLDGDRAVVVDATPAPAPTTTAEGSGRPGWLPWLLGAVLVAGLLTAAARRWRRSD